MKNQNITNQITIPNNDLENLKKFFPHCFDKNGCIDFEKLKKQLSDSNLDFSKESYGMDWLGKSYARLLATDPATTLLKEDTEWNNKQENKDSENLLIKGDNLEVLKHLSNAYYNQIKMIYIDPPYNTGTDGFVYEDDRKFTVKEFSELAGVDEEKAKKILSFVNSKSNSHSAWLTFMYPRLYIAKQLLKDEGVIFVSIDENEVAQLRILMDEIFGELNSLGTICWESKTKSQNTKDAYSKLQPKIEYILVYTKSNLRRFNLLEKGKKEYPLVDEKGKYRTHALEVMNAAGVRGRETMIFEIKGIVPPGGKQWKLGKESIEDYIRRDDLYLDEKKVVLKIRPELEKTEITEPFWGFFSKEIGTTESAKKELSEIIKTDKHGFETVKPIRLIEKLIFHSTDENDIVLDFFAGSGTTGDALMRINSKDYLGRKFILVQLPENIDKNSNKEAYDFVHSGLAVAHPTIFEITKERIIRATNKIKSEIKDNAHLGLGFKIFETTPIWENYNSDDKEYKEQTNLFDESILTEEDLQTLLTTWKVYDNIPLTVPLSKIQLNEYNGYYANNKLYLMHKGFTIKHLTDLLEKIDSDISFSPAKIIVFGFNFESKTLRELAENVASYANKKGLDIDLITRY
ncbi:MAG: site-specific DNA-methyltransferase [bacterium]